MQKKYKNQELMYKCYFIHCPAVYISRLYLSEHLKHSCHDLCVSLYQVKCPLKNCDYLIRLVNKESSDKKNFKSAKTKQILDTHILEYHEPFLNEANQIYADLEDLYSLYFANNFGKISSEICKNYFIYPIKHINFSDLKSSTTELFRLFDEMKNKRCFLVQTGENFECKIWGCEKLYTKKTAYTAHINSHKHSITKIIDFAITKFNIDVSCLIRELKDFDLIFCVDRVPKIFIGKADDLRPILFKNDVCIKNIQKSFFLNTNSIVTKANESSESFKSLYDSLNNKTSISIGVDKVYYKDKEYLDYFNLLAFNYVYYNIKKCITCCVITKTHSPILFVSTKEDYKYDVVSKFVVQSTHIYVFDLQLRLLDMFSIEYGYARKMLAIKNIESTIIYILFSDGFIRKLCYTPEKKKFYTINCLNLIDFIIVDTYVLVGTDGQVLYKIENDKVVQKSSFFDSFINSLCLRTSIKNGIVCKAENEPLDYNELLLEIQSKTNKNFIVFSTVNGHIYTIDTKFQNSLSVIKNFYSHKIVYFEQDDEILFTNQLHSTTKILNINNTYSKTKTLLDSIFFSAVRTSTGYLFGQNDGLLLFLKRSKKKTSPETLFRFVKKANTLFILDNISDIKYVEDKVSNCDINEICSYDNKIFIFLRCGVVFSFLCNK